jgi:hypothetical protein
VVTLLDGGEQLWRWPEPGHPDDPPLPEVRGVPRIMGTSAAFDRVLATVPGGITVCQGNFTLMTDDLPRSSAAGETPRPGPGGFPTTIPDMSAMLFSVMPPG